uniref:Uncharacterized protein n=1 Tax=Anguilla anguilla TaxID=7936 RepID=A0A0E9UK62_ANGAN
MYYCGAKRCGEKF